VWHAVRYLRVTSVHGPAHSVPQDSNGTLELAEWLEFSRRLALRGEAAAKRMIIRLKEIVKKEMDIAASSDGREGRPPAAATAPPSAAKPAGEPAKPE